MNFSEFSGRRTQSHLISQEGFKSDRVGLQQGFDRFYSVKRRRFHKPAPSCGQSPELGPPRVGQIPAEWRVFRIDCLIVRVEQLHPVAIRITEIDEKSVADAVPAGPSLQSVGASHARRNVAGVNKIAHFRHRVGEVMKPRTSAIAEHDVVGIAFAL